MPAIARPSFTSLQVGSESASLVTTIVVGTDPTFPPFEFLVDGEIVGFDVDLARAVAEEGGHEIELTSCPFSQLISSLGGRLNMVASALSITDARKSVIDFSDPYYTVPATHNEYGFGFSKGDVLRDDINSSLHILESNGTYDSIYQKWFGAQPRLTFSVASPTISYDSLMRPEPRCLPTTCSSKPSPAAPGAGQ
jgi:ABC-type amino acid transport substrate-binding protein